MTKLNSKRTLSQSGQYFLAGVLVFAARFAAPPTFSRADTTYTVTDLGVLPTTPSGRDYSTATAINDLGQVVGYVGDPSFSAPFIWSSSTGMVSLTGRSNPGFGAYAFGINNLGQVVGTAQFGPTSSNAFLWSPTSGISYFDNGTSARKINDNGVIVGQAGDGAVIWDTAGSLSHLSGQYPSSAASINSSGQIAGSVNGNAAIWSGSRYDVIGPGGASAINDAGQVAGDFTNAANMNQPFVWTSATGRVPISLLPQTQSAYTGGMNNSGQVVGTANLASGSNAFSWTSQKGMVNLNSKLDASGSGWTLYQAFAVNNYGLIIGNGAHDGVSRAFILQPSMTAAQTSQAAPSACTSVFAPTSQQLLVFNPATDTFSKTASINRAEPTAVLTHGFISDSCMWAGTHGFAEALYRADPQENIVAWDWSPEANNASLSLAASRTANEGFALGFNLSATLGPAYSNPVHFFGHSLGTLVNSKAIDEFHSLDAVAPIQDTLFDEASIANQFLWLSVGICR